MRMSGDRLTYSDYFTKYLQLKNKLVHLFVPNWSLLFICKTGHSPLILKILDVGQTRKAIPFNHSKYPFSEMTKITVPSLAWYG